MVVLSFGNVGLLIGLVYFCGVWMVNCIVVKLGGKKLMCVGVLLMVVVIVVMLLCWYLGVLEGKFGLLLFVCLYCFIIFG